ncbi:MAG: hypothetical protein QM647_02460 [Asticcacaulis sp.]|uniref:hypothetical protein n=1 Tax=Asticcacaulis sp. TaxID=1872648 RepID=UPI0039E437B4
MKRLILAALALSFTASAQAQTVDPASDLGQFRSLRGDGMTALDKGDTATAMDDFAKAQAILPDSPSIPLLRAQVFLKERRKTEAKAALLDYLKRGNVLDLTQNTEFNTIWDSDLENQLQLNQTTIGSMEGLAGLNGFNIVEGMAFVPDQQQLYLTSIHDGKVIALSPQGATDVINFRPGVAAYGLGLRDGTLYAATVHSRLTAGYDPAKPIASKIVSFSAADGKVLAAVTDPAKPDREFGHLLLGKDDLYVTDTAHGEVLRLTDYGQTLETLIPEGYMDNPQGLAENADATVLMVTDFTSGLYRVDLTSGAMARLLPPAEGNLLGITSLSRYGNDLIAVQNGLKPNRILRLHMSADWTQVDQVEILLRAPKSLAQPTQGVVNGDDFVFVADSQWSNLDDRGNAKSDTPGPAVIGVIKLKP